MRSDAKHHIFFLFYFFFSHFFRSFLSCFVFVYYYLLKLLLLPRPLPPPPPLQTVSVFIACTIDIIILTISSFVFLWRWFFSFDHLLHEQKSYIEYAFARDRTRSRAICISCPFSFGFQCVVAYRVRHCGVFYMELWLTQITVHANQWSARFSNKNKIQNECYCTPLVRAA